jgi:hypothetical protein
MIEVEGPDGSVVEFPDGTPNDVIEGAMAQRFGGPSSKPQPTNTDTSPLKGLAYGAEGVLRGADATTNELKSLLGMAKGRSMATALADKIHSGAGLDSYAPAGEGLMDNSKGVMERLTYAPRAMVEAAPSLVTQVGPGKLGTALALGSNAYQNLGNNLERADQSGAGRGGALAATGLDALLSRFGIEQTLGRGASRVGWDAAKKLVGGVAATGAENAAQTAIDRNLIDNKSVTANDLVVSGLTGAGASAAFKAARGDITDAGEAVRFRQFAGKDPKQLAAVAKLLQENTGSYGKIKESNAVDILGRARSSADGQRRLTASNNLIGGRSTVVDQLNDSGNLDASRAYVESQGLLGKGEPVPDDMLETLRGELGGQPINDQWLNEVEQASTLGQLSDIGNRGAGGIHATKLGQTLDRLAGYFGLGSLGGGLGASALGHTSLGNTGLAIGAGATGLNLGIKGLDALSGYSNPVGRFARRFADDAPTPLATTVPRPMSNPQPAAVAPAGPPPTTPQSLFLQSLGFAPGETPTPSEMGILGQILRRGEKDGREVNLGPMPGESLTEVPNRILPRGADADWRAPPAEAPADPRQLAKIDALVAQKTKAIPQVEPSDAFKATKAAAMAKRLERQRLMGKVEAKEPPPGIQSAPEAPVPPRAPRVAPAPEQATQDAPQTTEKPIYTTNVFGRDVSIPVDQIRRTPQAWERGVLRDATLRRQPIDQMKSMLPQDLQDNVEQLFTKWLSPGTKMDDAYFALEELVNDPRVPDDIKGKLLDMWSNNPDLTDPQHWK